jgi:glycosyltransferase involved in cell wall biosynthesis
VRTVRPDLLHFDEEPYNLATYLGARSARRAGVPLVFFTWQNLLRRYPPPFSWMERSVYRDAAAAMAGSAAAAEVLERKGYRGRVAVIPQFGVDPGELSPDGHRRPDGTFTIGFLNRLIPGKGPDLALRALEQLPGDTRLVMVGDGPLRGEVEEEIARRGLQSRVELRGRVASSDMPALYRSLDVVILPSITTPNWMEQFGRVLTEAMARGVPVVGSDSGEIPRVIGEAGLIVPEGDAAALAAALTRLHDDGALRARLAEQGRQRVLERFTNEQVARRSVQLYREVLSDHRASR